MSLIPQFKTELQYIPTVKACLKLSWVDCFCPGLKGSRVPYTFMNVGGVHECRPPLRNQGHFFPTFSHFI